MDHTFDWKPRFDERSKAYPVRDTIATPPKKRNKLWKIGPILDQGSEGACVGFGWSAEAFSTPVAVDLSRVRADVPRTPNQFALNTYHTAQKLDEWSGEAYDGTSVLAGAKALQQFGLLKEYRWAFSIEDVVDTILAKGPVVLGIHWFDGMYEAPNGVLSVSGPMVGGHCIAAVGFRLASDKLGGEDGIILQNSWGADWGMKGLAEIRVSDLAALLNEDGEACVPSRRSYGR